MKSKILTPVILILFLVMLTGSASGEQSTGRVDPKLSPKASGGNPQIGKADDMRIRMPASPWPAERGDAQRTGRSNFAGPGASIHETASEDLCDEEHLTYYHLVSNYEGQGPTYGQGPVYRWKDLEDKFSRLLIGPGNRLYFKLRRVETLTPTTFKDWEDVYSYDMAQGQMWNRWYGTLNVTLDPYGRMYDAMYVDAYGENKEYTKTACVNPDGSEAWEHKWNESHMPEVMAVGKKVYVSRIVDNEWSVTAYRQNGALLWVTHPHYAYGPHRVSEDLEENVYVFDGVWNLFKYDTESYQQWYINHPEMNTNGVHIFDDVETGPICSPDGKVMAVIPYIPKGLKTPGITWAVINPDGSYYKKGNFGNKGKPNQICLGSDGRLYICFDDGKIRCYTDWDHEEWVMDVSGFGKAYEMILGSDNNLYLLHTSWGIQALGEASYISVINASNGIVAKLIKVDLPEYAAALPGEIAIGDGKKLYYINEAGYLKEYSSSLLTMKPAEMPKITPRGG